MLKYVSHDKGAIARRCYLIASHLISLSSYSLRRGGHVSAIASDAEVIGAESTLMGHFDILKISIISSSLASAIVSKSEYI